MITEQSERLMEVPRPPVTDELVTQAHRRWIETRDARDGDKFAFLISKQIAESRAALKSSGGE